MAVTSVLDTLATGSPVTCEPSQEGCQPQPSPGARSTVSPQPRLATQIQTRERPCSASSSGDDLLCSRRSLAPCLPARLELCSWGCKRSEQGGRVLMGWQGVVIAPLRFLLASFVWSVWVLHVAGHCGASAGVGIMRTHVGVQIGGRGHKTLCCHWPRWIQVLPEDSGLTEGRM